MRARGSLIPAIAISAVACGAMSAVLLPSQARTGPSEQIGALPEIGVADQEAVVFGAVAEGAAKGTAWAYRRLPLDTPPAKTSDGVVEQGPITGSSSDPQLAFLEHSDGAGWRVAQVPLDLDGKPFRGPEPNLRGAMLGARGGGVVLGRDGSRAADRQLVVLHRNPGKAFRELPAPPVDVLFPASAPSDGDPAEALAGDRGAGRANLAVVDEESRTWLFAAPVGRDDERAVVVFDGEGSWSREELAAGDGGGLKATGIGAASTSEVWLAAASDGRPLRIFGRSQETGSPSPGLRGAGSAGRGPGGGKAASPDVGEEAPGGGGDPPAPDGEAGPGSGEDGVADDAPEQQREPEGGEQRPGISASPDGDPPGPPATDDRPGAGRPRSIAPPSSSDWGELALPTTPFTSSSAAAAVGVTEIRQLGGAAQAVTVAPGAIWVDFRLRWEEEYIDATILVQPDAAIGERIESWCDAPFCDHPLGMAFSTTDGYRSYAWTGSGAGQRVITNPLRPGAAGTSNLGTYAVLSGDRFERRPGGGGNFRAGGAFIAPDDGWLQGPVRIARGLDAPSRTVAWPVSARAPFTAVTAGPGSSGGSLSAPALAVGVDGAVARYAQDGGWTREFLFSSTGAVVYATLRGVAWPEADRAHAVGDNGAMWLWRADSGLWERDPAAPVGLEANLMAVAFDPTDPQRGYAVGKGGTILAYDKSWTPQELPAAFADANFTAVAFAGSEAIAVSDRGVLFNRGEGWSSEPQLTALIGSMPRAAPRLLTVAGLPDGGAVVAGRNFIAKRSDADAPWQFGDQPLPGSSVIALAAFREEGEVRAVASVVSGQDWPAPDPPIEVDPNAPPPIPPPFLLPGDGYLLRETTTGWRDEQRSAFGGSGSDRPLKSDPVLALALDEGGKGWVVGGWSGASDSAGRGTSARGGTGAAIRRRVQTAAILRYSPSGDPDSPPGQVESAIPLPEGKVRLAIGGHPECVSACADLANQAIHPDRMVQRALEIADALAGRDGGPEAFISTGSRIRPGSGFEGSAAESRRHAQLMSSKPNIPVYTAVADGDVAASSASAFREAFADGPRPMGQTGPGPAISTEGIPSTFAEPGARTHFAFDATGFAGKVRVIVIDNSKGSLTSSDPHQNPAEPQEPWLVNVLRDAKAKEIPSVVIGSRDLNSKATPKLNAATDADRVAKLLVDNGASAYFHDRPEENRYSSIPAGARTSIPQFGTGTLGYRSPIADAASIGQPDSLFGAGGFLLAEVDVAARDQDTNRAPVSVRLIPIVDNLSMLALDGTMVRRSRPALFQGVGRRPVSGDRWGRLGGDGLPSPSGADPYTSFPSEQCVIAGCSTRINPEFTFSSKDRDILDFVKQDPASTNLRKPLLGSDDKVITDPSSGLACPFNAGKTEVTLSAGGKGFTLPVEVLSGSVLRPCGTRPLDPSRFEQPDPVDPGTQPPPPAATPLPAILPSLVPPPSPPPAPFVSLFGGLIGAAAQAAAAPPPAAPPPPPTFFANPVPPGGATVKVEKREEEVAPEQSSASASAYNSDDNLPLAPIVGAVLLLAAIAGTTARPGRRRDPAWAMSRVTFDDRRDPRRSGGRLR